MSIYEEEIYVQIKDFPNYCVSNLGNIKYIKTNTILKQRFDKNGYKRVNLYDKNRKIFTKRTHRLVIEAFKENVDNKLCVDHIDNNRENNNICNLRYATHQENTRNSKIRKNSTSGIKGITYHKASNKWQARITIDGLEIHLGLFGNIEDAKQARVNKVKQVFGEFANKCETN